MPSALPTDTPATPRRALLSVSDKTGLAAFARRLAELGFELISTGGTARALQEAGLTVTPVSEVTGFPELLGGRVKTLHPAIHAGVLARADQRGELIAHGLAAIELVVVNLYPFREAAARPGVSEAEALEEIDIGGPTLLRAAAKNHPHTLVVVDPADYPRVAEALAANRADDLRRALARKAFAHTAAYDAAIVQWFDATMGDGALPETLHLALERRQVLRYGENPHQQGARYLDVGQRSCWEAAVKHKGAELSYLNLLDADAAWRLVHEFTAPAAVIVKHANPCGVALAERPADAYARAYACDPTSAFGGVVALNRTLDAETAEQLMANAKADVLLAPSYAPEALERLMARRKAMRVLELPPPEHQPLQLRRLGASLLVQEPDRVRLERDAWRVVTRAQPNAAQWRDLELAWLVCAYTASNAIVLASNGQALGVGAGQQSRVDAARIAVHKAAGRARGGAAASDAFFPFRDGLDALAEAGITAVIQPGGSVRDPEVIQAADEHGMAMVLTGTRHFRH